MTPSIRSSRSASSIARIGFLPPSSRPTLIIFFAALSYTCFPVSTPPVKETARRSNRHPDREAHLVRQLRRDRVAEHAAAFACGVLVEIDHFLDVAPALGDDFSHFRRDDPTQILLLPAEDPGGLEEQLPSAGR